MTQWNQIVIRESNTVNEETCPTPNPHLQHLYFSLIRDDEQLNERLTASKSQRMNGEADFKTLADVLIQCTFSHGLKTKVRFY